MKIKHKQIIVHEGTWEQLKELKEKGLSMDGLITKLITIYRETILETV